MRQLDGRHPIWCSGGTCGSGFAREDGGTVNIDIDGHAAELDDGLLAIAVCVVQVVDTEHGVVGGI